MYIYLYICKCTSIYISVSVHLSIYKCTPIYRHLLSVYLYLYTNLSVSAICLSVIVQCTPICPDAICLSVSVHLSVFLCYLSICDCTVYTYLSVSVHLSICKCTPISPLITVVYMSPSCLCMSRAGKGS